MIPLNLLFLLLALWMGYLAAEAMRLHRWQRAIPLRITVTGTRGKTSVARMLAAVLRANGRRVVAKTTGSEPRIILPDGRERPVRRRGVASILEQIGLLRIAVQERAQVVVAEIMSVHEENHRVESQRILRPHLVLVTNFRVDHTEAAGWTREEVAALHLADIPPGAVVLIPEGELVSGFAEAVEGMGSTLVTVASGKKEVPITPDSAPSATPAFLAENLALLRGAARELDIPEEAVIQGLREARGDLGAHWIRRYRHTRGGPGLLVVNAFAANDPRSTAILLEWVREQVQELSGGAHGGHFPDSSPGRRRVVGLLNLRADRGDRTIQWLEAMSGGFREQFQHLYLTGFHAPAFRRGLTRRGLGEGVYLLKEQDPGKVMEEILAGTEDPEPLLFGFGNVGGLGEAMVKHWMERSEEIDPSGRPGRGWVDPVGEETRVEMDGSGRGGRPSGPESDGDDPHGS